MNNPRAGSLHGRPNQPHDIGSTALHIAVKKRSDEIITLLLAAGADPSQKDANGVTPLELARRLRANSPVLVTMELTAIALKKAAHNERKQNGRAGATGGSVEGTKPPTAAKGTNEERAATAAAIAAASMAPAGSGGADATADAAMGGGVKEEPRAVAEDSRDCQARGTTTITAVGAVAMSSTTAAAAVRAGQPPLLVGTTFAEAKKPSGAHLTTILNAGTASAGVSMSASTSNKVSGGPITGSLYSAECHTIRGLVAPLVPTSVSLPLHAAGRERNGSVGAHMDPQNTSTNAFTNQLPSLHDNSTIERVGDR